MSWAISSSRFDGIPASEARQAIEADPSLPDCVKSYIAAGIDGLVDYLAQRPDVPVKISSHGHLCMGPGRYNVTTATITVSPA
jgi:hypothetical protein